MDAPSPSHLQERYLEVQGPHLSTRWILTVRSFLNRVLPVLGQTKCVEMKPYMLEIYRTQRLKGDLAADGHGAVMPRRYGASMLPDSEAAENYRLRAKAALNVFAAQLLLGARIGEILSLKWNQINLEDGFVDIYQSKTRKTNPVPISAPLRDILTGLQRGIGEAPVFRGPEGKAWAYRSLMRTFNLAKKLSGIRPALTPHVLRHAAASRAAQQGIPEKLVSDLTGHGSGRITQAYMHAEREQLRRVTDLIAAVAFQKGS